MLGRKFMADDRNNTIDVLEYMKADSQTQEDLLRSIDRSLQQLARNGVDLSERSAREINSGNRTANSRSSSRSSSRDYDEDRWTPNRSRGGRAKSGQDLVDDAIGSFFDSMEKSLFGDSLGNMIQDSLTNVADALGGSVNDLGKNFGDLAGKALGDFLGNNQAVNALVGPLREAKDNVASVINNSANNFADSLRKRTGSDQEGPSFSDITNAAQDASETLRKFGGNTKGVGADIAKMGQNVAEGMPEVGNVVEGVAQAGKNFLPAMEGGGEAAMTLGTAVSGAIPPLLIATAVLVVLDKLTEVVTEEFKKMAESAKELGQVMDDASKRTQQMIDQRLSAKLERIAKDNKAMIEASYAVMQDAAKSMLDSWDRNLTVITATQGYTKEATQDMISNMAKRLQEEGYDSVIAVSDITDNLNKVLSSGLSGTVAEEFAYMATVLNKAIPTEDFFSYAETYASIAANAIAAGKSQQEAIDYANSELQSFANNLLYASRDLAGGFSTGLNNASNLLASATKIAQTSRTGDISDISGVLTSVSAIVGAVAPDLASSLVDSIVSAATGGNAENITALRTLAGGGASNTAFLQQFASNPQQVFSTLFRNLGSMQNMSSNNYMEVAEGLSSVFGVSMDALARVDFNYLADAVDNMNVDSSALNKNMELLVSGQTTSTAEQLRAQEINRVMVEEGLTYVLDNEVARSIQEHMWEEQIANDLKESEFAVNVQGKALEFMQSILNGVTNILSFLNPIAWLKKGANLIATMDDVADMSSDIATLIESGKVGAGNAQSYYNLTTRGQDLNLTPNYLERMGQYSRYGSSAGILDNVPLLGNTIGQHVSAALDSNIGKQVTGALGLAGNLLATDFSAAAAQLSTNGSRIGNGIWGIASGTGQRASSVSSAYSWGNVSKSSMASAGGGKYDSSSAYAPLVLGSAAGGSSIQDQINKASQDRMQSYLDSMQTYVGEHKTYEEWAAAASDYGITDLEAALGDYGLSEADVMDQFQNLETEAGVQALYEKDMLEQKFWEDAIQWYEEEYPVWRDETWPTYTESLFGYLTNWNESLWPEYNTHLFTEVDEWKFNTWPAFLDNVELKHQELVELQNIIIELSDNLLTESVKMNKQFLHFYDDWTDYYIEHTAYTKATWNAYDVGAIRSAERSADGDAVLTLAQALTANAVDLKDPAVQTNVLLSKILLVAEAIMQQNNDTTSVSLPTALSALGLGVTSESI